ncbi:MAG TPA: hypothetical protein VM187_05580 [Niastella sp.]|nr:hypothetical protein [Niastella sp.]
MMMQMLFFNTAAMGFKYAYRTTLSWWVFAGAGALAMLIALITVSFKALKAAAANPVKN